MEDGRGSSGIGSGKSIGLAEGVLLPAEAVESNRSRPRSGNVLLRGSYVTYINIKKKKLQFSQIKNLTSGEKD